MSQLLKIFAGYGIELEYMIVDRESLKPLAIADQLLNSFAGEIVEDYDFGEVGISNELALHVIELKGSGAKADLPALSRQLQLAIKQINDKLSKFNAMLLPTAMHPTLDPLRDTSLWPHGNREIYNAYNDIFDCRGHGWSNLQSIHINFPFSNDEEFGRLHAAIRVCLPLLPAIAASSPIADGKFTGLLDTRLQVYRNNQKAVPSITGQVIPEACFDKKTYDRDIFQKMYRDIAPHDPQGLLQHEWLNSRGAIARWDRHAIEIRVLDIQECLSADFAVITATISLVKSLAEERWASLSELKKWGTQPLANIFFNFVEGNEQTTIVDRDYLGLFNYAATSAPTYLQLWQHIAKDLVEWKYPLRDSVPQFTKIVEQGNLATRISKGVKTSDIKSVYQNLAKCLANNQMYQP